MNSKSRDGDLDKNASAASTLAHIGMINHYLAGLSQGHHANVWVSPLRAARGYDIAFFPFAASQDCGNAAPFQI
jgi:hypothetical protein